jgi:hypothetical protein
LLLFGVLLVLVWMVRAPIQDVDQWPQFASFREAHSRKAERKMNEENRKIWRK